MSQALQSRWTNCMFALPWRVKFNAKTLEYIQSVESGNYAKAARLHVIQPASIVNHVVRVMECYCIHNSIELPEDSIKNQRYKALLNENFADVIEYIKSNLVDEHNNYLIEHSTPCFTVANRADLISKNIFSIDDLKKHAERNRLKDYLTPSAYKVALTLLSLESEQSKTS